MSNKRVLFLFSDTGGGHRSAAEAIIEALILKYGTSIQSEMVDILKEYSPPPLNRFPTLYPSMVKIPKAWKLGFYLSNGPTQAKVLNVSSPLYMQNKIKEMTVIHASDLIVCVHPLGVANILPALDKQHPPFITVVTDLVSTHAFWFHKNADLCIVPTDSARQRAINFGIEPEKIIVVGLPVALKFCEHVGNKNQLRETLGWPQNKLTTLIIGGGEGMGPLEQTALALDNSNLPITLVIVTGRNEKLKRKLETLKWLHPTYIYGFTQQMPEMMTAADILLTKAGPGTISEALNIGLPMILYSKLPGQEDGNIDYISSEGAGVWAPTIKEILSTISLWNDQPELLEKIINNCKRISKPNASEKIAEIIGNFLGISLLNE